jgi:predicted phosphodiesterase
MYDASKILYGGMQSIVELTLKNQKLKMQKTYKIFVAHRASSSSSTSVEAILRSFRKKQACFPGIDVIVFGHYHRRFIQSDGYWDSHEDRFKKILYVVNPSPMGLVEYAEEAGYPPLAINHYVNFFLSIDQNIQPYGLV